MSVQVLPHGVVAGDPDPLCLGRVSHFPSQIFVRLCCVSQHDPGARDDALPKVGRHPSARHHIALLLQCHQLRAIYENGGETNFAGTYNETEQYCYWIKLISRSHSRKLDRTSLRNGTTRIRSMPVRRTLPRPITSTRGGILSRVNPMDRLMTSSTPSMLQPLL